MRLASRLALRDLSTQWGQAIALGAVFAIAVAAFLTLDTFQKTLAREYRPTPGNLLIVQEAQTFGEFYGSRLPIEVGRELQEMGVQSPVPEIHGLVGTSLQDAVLLHGVDLEHFTELNSFDLLAGRSLEPGDPPRRVMLGTRLAERMSAGPGNTVRLRGRPFEVVGVFETGTYAENEAWVPLAGAQELLGWGEEVSVFVVPGDGPLEPGDEIRPGVSVARRGELWSTFPRQWDGLMNLIRTVTQAIGVAAALSLATTLWRLARRRQWQFAILRSVGFGPQVLSTYLIVQGGTVALSGGVAGAAVALGLLRWVRPTVAGVSLRPHITAETLMLAIVWVGILTALSVAVPVWVLGRRRVTDLIAAG